jgi:hypothetical protein
VDVAQVRATSSWLYCSPFSRRIASNRRSIFWARGAPSWVFAKAEACGEFSGSKGSPCMSKAADRRTDYGIAYVPPERSLATMAAAL